MAATCDTQDTLQRELIRQHLYAEEPEDIARLVAMAGLDAKASTAISKRSSDMVAAIRASDSTGMMERFLAEYGLSSKEGVALMCLAEALLRVPDSGTIDELIEDKIVPGAWSEHLGRSSSSLVNASTWALLITGQVLVEEKPSLAATLRNAIRRLGEPVIRRAVAQAMRELGRQFVLAETIGEAVKFTSPERAQGYTYSFDMLGEAARTDADAKRYHLAYGDAITEIARVAKHNDIARNPGISVKLSALYARYEYPHKEQVMQRLLPRLKALCQLASSANIGFNIDAEEADRLELSLDVIEALLGDEALRGWDGFGVVVQAYGPRAPYVIDWLEGLGRRLNQKVMVRLVKGAYWDAEIKRAQTLGLPGFPVFTRKPLTDVSYIACAQKLLAARKHIYPQFATHNAHTTMAILHLAARAGADPAREFEFQRLHGMGEALARHGCLRRIKVLHPVPHLRPRRCASAICWPILSAAC